MPSRSGPNRRASHRCRRTSAAVRQWSPRTRFAPRNQRERTAGAIAAGCRTWVNSCRMISRKKRWPPSPPRSVTRCVRARSDQGERGKAQGQPAFLVVLTALVFLTEVVITGDLEEKKAAICGDLQLEARPPSSSSALDSNLINRSSSSSIGSSAAVRSPWKWGVSRR